MSVRERVGEHRHRMRARGYRPVQVWVPDVRSEQFVREARRQAALIARFDRHTDDQDFVEAVSVDWGEE
ncbi:MAG TPA: antitoxin MazE family protein [Dermatophilaceae bacterium]|nr:antitoxin MazE family protein [Dermatophilaceae bacterium]